MVVVGSRQKKRRKTVLCLARMRKRRRRRAKWQSQRQDTIDRHDSGHGTGGPGAEPRRQKESAGEAPRQR